MQFRLRPEILARFPQTLVGVLFLEETTNPPSSEALKHLLFAETERIRTSYTLEALLRDTRITRWREIYPHFGAKPRDYRSSIEALGRRCVNGKGIPSISSLVDSYNIVSLKYLLTAGGEDLDQVQGDIELAIAGDHEPAVQLLGDTEPKSPFPGEVIYKDQLSAICRCWNWREADRTKLTEKTTRCVLVLEDLAPSSETLQKALEELRALVQDHCGGKTRLFILNQEVPSCTF